MGLGYNQLLMIIICVISICAGQILFKLTGLNFVAADRFIFSKGFYYAVTGLLIYGGATLLWIYILRTVPLSSAYPFMALSYAIVPIAGYFLFSEKISLLYAVGIALIIAGVMITSLASSK